MNRISFFLSILAWSSLCLAQADTGDSLSALNAEFEDASGVLRAQAAVQIEQLLEGYSGALQRLGLASAKRGDLDAVVAIKKEQDSIQTTPMTEEQIAALGSELGALRVKLDRELVRIGQVVQSQEIALLERHFKNMYALQVKLTKAGQLDAAVEVLEAGKAVKARMEELKSGSAIAVAPPAGGQTRPDRPNPTPSGGIGATAGAKPSPVAEMVRAKGTVDGAAVGVIPFDGPTGDGRRGAKGILIKQEGEEDGSTWSFIYARGGTARGLQIFHPRGDGQAIVHINKGSIGISTPEAWRSIGYNGGNTGGVEVARAFEETFPLKDGTEYAIFSRMNRGGSYEVFIDGNLVAEAKVGRAHPLSFEIPEGQRFPGSSSWDKLAFKGEGFPLQWEANWAGLLLGPLDGGTHLCRRVHFCPGVAEIPKAER